MSRTPGTPRLLRAINDRAALALLLEQGPLSRVQLGALTGLSKPTSSQLLARLERAGLVVQVGMSAGGRGPNAALYAVNAAAAYVAGIDLVPERMAVAVADITGTVLGDYEVATEPGRDDDPVTEVRAALTAAARRAGIRVGDLVGVVLGVPGAHDEATDTLRHADFLPAWTRPGVLGRLRNRLGRRVGFENDVNLAAVAERRHGSAGEVGTFALLWVGDGLGLAIDLGGALHRGATGGAGEIGYMPVAQPADAESGDRGPVHDFHDLIGPDAVLAIAQAHGVAGSTADKAVAVAVETRNVGFLQTFAVRIATGLATIVAVLDPEIVVLAGAVCRAGGAELAGRVERRLHELTPLHPPVATSAIDGNPVLLGALDLALEEARDEVFGARELRGLAGPPGATRR